MRSVLSLKYDFIEHVYPFSTLRYALTAMKRFVGGSMLAEASKALLRLL